ncbi:MAG: hypothetical protein JST37_14365 [Bacteroidetes bacterium]|nr:hypothetical protein [Bacteroidota bacterium]MBS1982300.1 hypothetical protein [Bacteroidota bacterium]
MQTTLVRPSFPSDQSVNLENPDTLEKAKSDPRLFFRNAIAALSSMRLKRCLSCFPTFKLYVMSEIEAVSLFWIKSKKQAWMR